VTTIPRVGRRLSRARFFEELGYRPHPGQWAVHQSRAPRRVLASGVRWGKTTAAAMEGLAAAMEPAERSIGWVVAPTYDLADRVFREIQYTAAEKLAHHVVSMRESDRRIVLRNMGGGLSEIRAKSADNPVSLLGEGLDWLVVDEAARLRPSIWQSHLSQRLIDKRGWALLISTPRGKGYLFDLFRRGQGGDPEYESWSQPSWTNPLLDASLIEAERARLPSRVFAQEYGAEWIEGSGAVFRYVRDCATGTFRPYEPGTSYQAGLDLARIEDFTVLVISDRERRVCHVERFNRVDWAVQIKRVKAALDRYGNPRVVVDTTGAGDPVHQALRHENICTRPYPFTAKSKAALINNLVLLFEQKDLVLPRPELWPEGIDELEAYEFTESEAGNLKMGAPSGMHDDCVIGLALSMWKLSRASYRLAIA
jgi:hypothetical protein